MRQEPIRLFSRADAMLLLTLVMTFAGAQTARADAWTDAGGTGGSGTTDDPYYVNMPTTGTRTVTIPTGVQSFKVYDDGGATGKYSNSCSGTLTLTAPDGYVLRLSGNIRTQISDKLTVYDGTDNTFSKLLDGVSSSITGTQTAITTVTSSGRTHR